MQTAAHPPLLFDYYGFPPHTYELTYPAPGAPDLARRVRELLEGFRIGKMDALQVAARCPELVAELTETPALVAFLAAERVALSYAVGEWARVWPLQQLIRSMGAYFVRRNSGDALYRTVLARYVQMAVEGGVPQAVYPEGGLTVDGRLRPPRAAGSLRRRRHGIRDGEADARLPAQGGR